ncbi:Uncharacterised protein [Neisseria zoodegmatis]|uniref:Uncharacterized protein n=1 Tax=Neisseria zoodegmatis TaxID=326523 RepID=A0A378WIK2_9NEIS|nr:hypothetical protein [Neisseria zoodegmatis]SUA36293.1 Uncharacterised protein [Neisseria zoodegmatis]
MEAIFFLILIFGIFNFIKWRKKTKWRDQCCLMPINDFLKLLETMDLDYKEARLLCSSLVYQATHVINATTPIHLNPYNFQKLKYNPLVFFGLLAHEFESTATFAAREHALQQQSRIYLTILMLYVIENKGIDYLYHLAIVSGRRINDENP